jgi:pimeloyl-ACP methyl ester carboxylesterase
LPDDIAELIQALSPGAPAVVIGHDWGAPISWTSALVHPEQVRAVAGLSVPYVGIPKRSLNGVIDNLYTSKGRSFYQHYFAQEGAAEAEMGADVRGALKRFTMRCAATRPTELDPPTRRLVIHCCIEYRTPMYFRLGDPQVILITTLTNSNAQGFMTVEPIPQP